MKQRSSSIRIIDTLAGRKCGNSSADRRSVQVRYHTAKEAPSDLRQGVRRPHGRSFRQSLTEGPRSKARIALCSLSHGSTAQS